MRQQIGVKMFIVAELKTDGGQLVTILTVPPKEFKTGSRGFFGNGKVELDGKRYQVQIQMVEIGSKKEAETK
jgi:hypothetical protein